MTDPDASQVIVAGAGPVGLTTALSLAIAGISVTVLEKRAALNTASRASTIHPPTLEILDRLGVLSMVCGEAELAERIQYRSPEGVFAAFDLGVLAGETPFPYRLHLEQSRITPVILDRLRNHPHAQVRFGCEVTGVSQTTVGVMATVRNAGSDQVINARYLVAADGAHSRVREALGLTFDGVEYPDKILRVMTQDDLGDLLPGIAPVTYLFNGSRSISFLKMPDCWRIILRVPKEVSDEQAMDEAWILSRFQAVLPSCTRLPGVVRKDIFGASRRVASRFRHGRVYLAGDAAHLTNTRGGMNMNCGIHDAAALAEALTVALQQGDTMAVDAVSDERHRIATEYLIPRTDRNVSAGPAWTEMLRATAARADAALVYLRTVAMLDMLDRSTIHVGD